MTYNSFTIYFRNVTRTFISYILTNFIMSLHEPSPRLAFDVLWIFCDNFRSFIVITNRFLVGSHCFYSWVIGNIFYQGLSFSFAMLTTNHLILDFLKLLLFFVEDQTCFLFIYWKRICKT